MIVVHAGKRVDAPGRVPARFPAANEVAVAARIGLLFDLLQPEAVVTAAAAGADLLVVEAARHRNLRVHLVLPFDRQRFRATSVDDQGQRWTSAYDAALSGVTADPGSSLVELALEPDEAGFRAGNQALIDRATDLAPGDVLALVVRPRPRGGAASITDDFARRADAAGLFVVEIDPTPRRPATP